MSKRKGSDIQRFAENLQGELPGVEIETLGEDGKSWWVSFNKDRKFYYEIEFRTNGAVYSSWAYEGKEILPFTAHDAKLPSDEESIRRAVLEFFAADADTSAA